MFCFLKQIYAGVNTETFQCPFMCYRLQAQLLTITPHITHITSAFSLLVVSAERSWWSARRSTLWRSSWTLSDPSEIARKTTAAAAATFAAYLTESSIPPAVWWVIFLYKSLPLGGCRFRHRKKMTFPQRKASNSKYYRVVHNLCTPSYDWCSTRG